jgi:hypothetical protein
MLCNYVYQRVYSKHEHILSLLIHMDGSVLVFEHGKPCKCGSAGSSDD